MKINAFALAVLVASANAGVNAKKQKQHDTKNTKKHDDVNKLRGQKEDEQHRELHPHSCYTCSDHPCYHGGPSYLTHCDPTKYIQCGSGSHPECYELDCPHGLVWNGHTCADPGHTPTHPTHPPVDGPCDDGCPNPCEYPGQYFPHCSFDLTKYLQCGAGNKCVYGQCMHGNVWDPTVGPKGTCVSPHTPTHPTHPTHPPVDGPCDDGCPNPCTHPGQYFPHCGPDLAKYIQCGAGNRCVVGRCMHGNVWDPNVGPVGTCVAPPGGHPPHPPHTTDPPRPPACDECQDLCYDLPYYKDTMPCKNAGGHIVFDKYVVCSHGHHHHHHGSWGGHRYCAHEIECSGASEFYKECFDPFTGLNNVGCADNDSCPGMDNRRITKTPE